MTATDAANTKADKADKAAALIHKIKGTDDFYEVLGVFLLAVACCVFVRTRMHPGSRSLSLTSAACW